MMNEHGKSDRFIVPEKSPNQAPRVAWEEMEGRSLAKGNLHQQNTFRTPSREDVSSALERVRVRGWSRSNRLYLRQEPDEVIPQVRIRAGGAE